MRQITMIRTLGILLISYAVISFLFQGWNDFNGLEKFLIFFLFSIGLFTLSEMLKKFSSTVSKIFGVLFIGMTPAMAAQLGAYLLGDDVVQLPSFFTPSPLPDHSPVRFICIVTLILNALIMSRLLKRFQSQNLTVDLSFFILSWAIFLIPMRSPEFHACALLLIFCCSLYCGLRGPLTELGFTVSSLIRMAPLLIFLVRAVLYPTNSALMIAIWSMISISGFYALPKLTQLTNLKETFYSLGSVGVIFLSHEVANYGLWSNYMWTIVFLEGLFILLAVLNEEARRVLSFFIVFFAWFNLLRLWFSSEALTISTVSVHIGLPLALSMACFFLRQSFGLVANASLTLVSMVYFILKLVEWPVLNSWIVFGIIGVLLLVLSSIIEKPNQRLLEVWEKIKDSLEQ